MLVMNQIHWLQNLCSIIIMLKIVIRLKKVLKYVSINAYILIIYLKKALKYLINKLILFCSIRERTGRDRQVSIFVERRWLCLDSYTSNCTK